MAKSKKETQPDEELEVSAKSFFTDERIKLLSGVFILSFSVFLLVAYVSYLFTWQHDQSILDISFFKLFFNPEIVVENWTGKLGAALAYLLIRNWFGLASISIIFLISLLGFRLLNFRLLPFKKSLKFSIIYTLWFSIALGYLFQKGGFTPGGAHGYFVSVWLNAFMGKVGTAFLLLVSLFTILSYSFDSFVPAVLRLLANIKQAAANRKTRVNNPSELTFADAPLTDDAETRDGFQSEPTTTEQEVKTKKKKNKNEPEVVFDVKNITDSVAENTENEPDSLLSNLELMEGSASKNITDEVLVDENFTIEIPKPNVDEEFKEEPIIEEPEDDLVLIDDEGIDIEKLTTVDDEMAEEFSNIALGDYDPTKELSNYKLPPVDLLAEHDASNESVSEEELISNKNRIVETLSHYKIQIDKIKAIVGPTITLYEIVPAPGVRISKIKNLEDDIALSLAALGIRIIAPIPGRGTIGIEVPNLKPEIVSMRSIISSKKFQESKMDLPIALGKTISNETYVFDLTKMPHLLVAGATGQGKSVGLNAILTSLLYKKHPSQLKLVLVDPKKVELTLYQKLENYFLAKLPDAEESIITDTQKVVHTLNSLCIEMDTRYDLLKAAQTRNIKEYNTKFVARRLNPEKGHRFLPYIVVVIDEFADLIMTAGKEVELPIARLAQLARAIGIHLIIATQRPTTNIITGLIKANFPARIAFRVTSMMDSRTILDSPGANQLIGRGDMLISQGNDMVRVQCAFVDTPELEEIMNYISTQQSYPTPFYLPEYVDENSSDVSDVDLTKRDSLFEEAAHLIVINQQGSTSLIQRKFSIGYNRAGRIMDQLEAANIVGPFEGSKARQVLITDLSNLEQILSRFS